MLRDENDDGSLQPSSSDPGQSLCLTKMMERMMEVVDRKFNNFRMEMPLMVVKIVSQEIKQVFEDLLRKVVNEELQKLTSEGTRNNVPEEKNLHLKFLDEVSGPVQTSKEFKGIKDGPLQVALFDATGNIVKSGPESSAEVEIVLIDASGSNNENNTIDETFERRIIKAGNKEKPHFAKNVYINLKEGKGILINQKLGQDSDWTKNCSCRLGARFVKNFRGLKVQNAWTEPFEVKDNRGQLYNKDEIPSLGSEVWRLNGIGRNGKPRENLDQKKIEKVKDLLFWLSIDPKGLQNILGAGDSRWKTIVDHARTCTIDDKMLYCHKSCIEPQMGVIYDSVGGLKGIIDGCQIVPIDSLSGDKKDDANKLLRSVLEPSTTFVERYTIPFNDEPSLLQRYPYKSSASRNCSIQQCLNGIRSESQSINPTNISNSLEPREVGELCNNSSESIPDHENIDGDNPSVLDDEIQTSRLFLEASEFLDNVNPLNDMNQSSGSNTQHMALNADESLSEEWRGWISTPENYIDHCTPSHMVADDPSAVVNTTPHASRRWKQLLYVVTLSISCSKKRKRKTLSISISETPNVTHPKRTKQ